MVRFSSKQDYKIVLQINVKGSVKEPDITGALFSWSAEAYPKFSIAKLQNNRKVGKIEIDVKYNHEKNQTSALVQVPVMGTRLQTSIIASILETLPKISVYQIKVRIREIIASSKDYSAKLIKRSLQIFKTCFAQEDMISTDILQKLEQLVSQKKATTLGTFTLGSGFKDAETIFIVEGRRDVALLSKIHVHNSLGVGGINYNPESLAELVGDKKVVIMCDGDKGGSLLKQSLITNLGDKVKYLVELSSNTSVEDLNLDQLRNYIKNKKPYFNEIDNSERKTTLDEK